MMPCQPMTMMGPERVLRVAMSDTYTALTWCSTPTTKWRGGMGYHISYY